jgi:hypothetical protein
VGDAIVSFVDKSNVISRTKLQLKRDAQIFPALHRFSCPVRLLPYAHRFRKFSISYPYFQGTLGNVKFGYEFLLVHSLHIHSFWLEKAYSGVSYISPEPIFVPCRYNFGVRRRVTAAGKT